MNIFIKGKGPVSIDKNADAVGSGGQANIYAKNGIAYKIYKDPSLMIPVSKIQELSVLNNNNIIKPDDIIVEEKKNKPIGYTMKFLKNSFAMCQIFPKAFKKRNGITPDMTLNLVKKLQEIVKHCHKNNILIVDLNEMNFMIDDRFNDLYAIDVDSYQTPSYPAQFLMESVRDRHCKNNAWNEMTDWFSFGIVSFNMFIGIHPYKGTHPKYDKNDLDGRMNDNISVFHKDVSLPPVVLPFDVIPDNFRDWYKAIFENGDRTIPPFDGQTVIFVVPKVVRITGSKNFIIKIVEDYGEDITLMEFLNNQKIALTSKGLHINSRIDSKVSANSQFGITPKLLHVIAGHTYAGKALFYNATLGKDIVCNLAGEKIMAYDGRLYLKNADSLYEVNFIELPMSTLVNLKPIAKVLENSTQMFDGVVIQKLLGAFHISLFPQTGIHRQIKIDEIADYRIIDGKFDNNVLMLIGEKSGKYDHFIFRFDDEYKTYDVRVINDITLSGLNFVTLDNGICAYINNDSDLELFFNKKGSLSSKIINSEPAIDGIKLVKNGNKTMFTKGDIVYNLEMNKSN